MNINTTEDVGICFEKSICDISGIPFTTVRRNIVENHLDMGSDSEFVDMVLSLGIDSHVGGSNTAADFVLKNGKSMSVKTNIRGFKVCPQIIGQTNLKKLSQNIGYNFTDVPNFKKIVFEDTAKIMETYLQNLFCCDMTLYANFEKGWCSIISKLHEVKISKKSFEFSRPLEAWNESVSIRLEKLPFAELQVHCNRNVIKCRFNMKNIISLVKSSVISGLESKEINLSGQYNFQVKKSKSFNYIGSKIKLLDFIQGSVENYIGKPLSEVHSMVDCFSGSGAVANHFIQSGCKNVTVNDNQYYASIISSILTKENMDIKKLSRIIVDINKNNESLSAPTETDFIYNNYTPNSGCERMYFTLENGLKIDRTRQYIEKIRGDLNDKEYRFLLKVLLYAITSISNCAAVFGAYLKKFKASSLKPLTLDVNILNNLSGETGVHHAFYNKDIIELLLGNSFDDVEVCYIDSPYNGRKYSSNFHLLETIALYDYPRIKGKTGLRVDEAKGASSFCLKSSVEEKFREILSMVKTKFVFISYSSESLIPKDKMVSLLQENWGNVVCKEKQYKRFKSNNIAPQEKFIKEYLFCASKVN